MASSDKAVTMDIKSGKGKECCHEATQNTHPELFTDLVFKNQQFKNH